MSFTHVPAHKVPYTHLFLNSLKIICIHPHICCVSVFSVTALRPIYDFAKCCAMQCDCDTLATLLLHHSVLLSGMKVLKFLKKYCLSHFQRKFISTTARRLGLHTDEVHFRAERLIMNVSITRRLIIYLKTVQCTHIHNVAWNKYMQTTHRLWQRA